MFRPPNPTIGELPLAQHKSARKRARQAVKRRAHNRGIRSSVRTGVKSAHTAIESGDGEATTAAVRLAEGLLRRAASKGVIPKKRARRQVSRLAKRAHRAAQA
jgi:small subunit ribosomal protein S20